MTDDAKPAADPTAAEITAELAKPQRKRRLVELLAEQDHRRNVAQT